MGVHFRGTDQKIAPNHAHPPTIFEIDSLIKKKVLNGNFNKIFLLTEDLNYYRKLKKKYKDLIYTYDYFRGNNIEEFSNSNRKHHIDNGIKSPSAVIARVSWYLSIYFPQLLKHYLSIITRL